MAAALRWSDLQTLTTPAGVLTFNEATGDTYFVDPERSSPLGAGATDAPVDDKGQTHGSLLHPAFEKGALLVVAGVVLARTDTTGVAGADALMTDMIAKCRSILDATGTLAFGSGASIVGQCNLLPTFPHLRGDLKGFLFGFVSESVMPT
jgi:hypothetical protein